MHGTPGSLALMQQCNQTAHVAIIRRSHYTCRIALLSAIYSFAILPWCLIQCKHTLLSCWVRVSWHNGEVYHTPDNQLYQIINYLHGGNVGYTYRSCLHWRTSYALYIQAVLWFSLFNIHCKKKVNSATNMPELTFSQRGKLYLWICERFSKWANLAILKGQGCLSYHGPLEDVFWIIYVHNAHNQTCTMHRWCQSVANHMHTHIHV